MNILEDIVLARRSTDHGSRPPTAAMGIVLDIVPMEDLHQLPFQLYQLLQHR